MNGVDILWINFFLISLKSSGGEGNGNPLQYSCLTPQKAAQRNILGFPDSSVGKESTCDAGNPSWIPGLGWSAGEGIGYLLQYSWASLVAQLVKNLPAMQETWVQSLGWEDPLEKGTAAHSSILAWRIPWTEEAGGLRSRGSQKVRHNWVTNTHTYTHTHIHTYSGNIIEKSIEFRAIEPPS